MQPSALSDRGWCGDRGRGASMGRPSSHPGDEPEGKLRLARMAIDSGGYDRGGAYWGLGQPIYEAWDDNGFYWTGRCAGREAAKDMLRLDYPDAKFYR